MAVTAQGAVYGTPETYNIAIGTASATGKINVGDWVLYSGVFVYAGSSFTPANKASGAGIALQPNPTYDSYGNIVTATAMQYARQGIFRVSAESGAVKWALGQPVYPSGTGSGLHAPTGLTGVWALWDQAAKQTVVTAGVSPTGAVITFGTGIAYVVGFNSGLGGNTATLDILLQPPRPDYY